jgi:ketosteroid isomerase-like protein
MRGNCGRNSASILKIPANYAKAFETGDVELAVALWDKNGIQMPPDAPHVIGIEEIRKSYEGLFAAFENLEMYITIEEAKAVSSKWGFMWGTFICTGTSKLGGPGLYVDGKVTTIVKKRHHRDKYRKSLGPWKIYIDCFNSNVP